MINISLSIFQLSCSAKTTSFTSWLAGQLFEHFGMCREASVTPQMWNNLGTNLALYGHLPALTGGSGATIAIRCRHIAFRFDMCRQEVQKYPILPLLICLAVWCAPAEVTQGRRAGPSSVARSSWRSDWRGSATARRRRTDPRNLYCGSRKNVYWSENGVLNLASMIPAYSLMSFHPVWFILKLIV